MSADILSTRQVYSKATLTIDVSLKTKLERCDDLEKLREHNKAALDEGRYEDWLNPADVMPLPKPRTLRVSNLVIETITKP